MRGNQLVSLSHPAKIQCRSDSVGGSSVRNSAELTTYRCPAGKFMMACSLKVNRSLPGAGSFEMYSPGIVGMTAVEMGTALLIQLRSAHPQQRRL